MSHLNVKSKSYQVLPYNLALARGSELWEMLHLQLSLNHLIRVCYFRTFDAVLDPLFNLSSKTSIAMFSYWLSFAAICLLHWYSTLSLTANATYLNNYFRLFAKMNSDVNGVPDGAVAKINISLDKHSLDDRSRFWMYAWFWKIMSACTWDLEM